ncbi:MAG: hypothetical protein NT075_31705, partial [Chloroflexi bacterium]|nr:hypothetical protein [Chloroflexota bacterium]
MQYFRPGGIYFVGDAMPFFHDGVFHLFYLLDEEHHKAKNGLGGHQWAHATTTDLVHWTHHPLALAITKPDEGSICTGSVFFHAGQYYAWYATRTLERAQHLSLAVSADGINFCKTEPNPVAMPGSGYSPYHFRDPFMFQDPTTALFHLLITAELVDYPLTKRGGCLAHLVSDDLQTWRREEPFLLPGFDKEPECPDLFFWNGWYYLLFGNGLVTHYRMARQPLGPWLRPAIDRLDGNLACVMKTAAFTGNRRIGVAWIGTREHDKDEGRLQWGGQLVFRELVQFSDGTLGSCFPPELLPNAGAPLPLKFAGLLGHAELAEDAIVLNAPQGLAVGMLPEIPQNVRLTLQINPSENAAQFGLRLRGYGQFEGGYELSFYPAERLVKLHNEVIYGVAGLDQPFTLEIILAVDIIVVNIDKRRCLIIRCPEQHGEQLFF